MLNSSAVTDNRARTLGGGIFNTGGGTVTSSSSTVKHNPTRRLQRLLARPGPAAVDQKTPPLHGPASGRNRAAVGDVGGASHTFTGTYHIAGGTSQYQSASGSGTATTSDNGAGQVTSSKEKGTIHYFSGDNDSSGT